MTIGPVEQHELLGEITTILVAELPAGWHRLVVEYRAIGRQVGVGSGLRMADGSTVRFAVPKTLAPLFARLRRGMYVEGQGTWHSLDLTVDVPDRYGVRYERDGEPTFAVGPEQFAVEQERFPRAPGFQPAWFSAGTAGPAAPR